MARIRTIKPEFFKNENLADLPALDRLLFIGLWTLSDRAGRLEDRPKRIRAEIFPYDENYNVETGLSNLANAGFILRYQVSELPYIQVVNFVKHQHPHVKEVASTIPAPCKPGAIPVQEPCNPDTSPVLARHLQVGEQEHLQVGEGAVDDGFDEKKFIDDDIANELSIRIENKIRHGAPAGPTPSKIGIIALVDRDNEMATWRTDAAIREAFTRGRKIPPDRFDEYLSEFMAELAIRTEPHKSATDLRQHFLNYAARRYAEAKGPAPGGALRTYRRPNGSPNNFPSAPARKKQPF